MIRVDQNGDVTIMTWSQVVGEERGREIDDHNALVQRRWQRLANGEEVALTAEAFGRWGIPSAHAEEMARIVLRYGSYYEPEYAMPGVIAANLGDPNLDEIERLGWPLGKFEMWLAHHESTCRRRGVESCCEFCVRVTAWRVTNLTADEIGEIDARIRSRQ